MVPRKEVEGKIFKFKSRPECFDLGLPTLDVPDVVRRHLVLVLNIVPGKWDTVKIMTVSIERSR